MVLVAGVDSSTQSTTVELRELDSGAVVGSARAAHPPTTPPVSEQHPDAWWAALVAALAELVDQLPRVAAVSVAGQQHGLVVLDGSGAVIRPAKLWNDTTSAPEAGALVERLGAEAWAVACGSVPVASFTVTKLAWLVGHEPGNAGRIEQVMLPHDWLTWRLSGRHVTDRGDASGTGWWSPAEERYRDDLLGLVVADPSAWRSRLPAVLGPGQPAGSLTIDAAAGTGLPAGIPVGPGTGDNMAAALGLGLGPGDLAVSLGTSGVAYAVSDVPTADPTGAVAGFADATGRFLPLVCTLNATKVTDAVARWLGVGLDELASLALDAGPADGSGPVLVPYLDGERTPNRPDATGTLVGLRTTTGRDELARAAHQGVLCGLLDGVDALRDAGVAVDGRLHLIGGGARSAAYRRLAAELWGRPVVVPHIEEAVATGACVQAAAVLTGEPPLAIARAWGLGAGDEVGPRSGADAAAARAAYRAATRSADP